MGATRDTPGLDGVEAKRNMEDAVIRDQWSDCARCCDLGSDFRLLYPRLQAATAFSAISHPLIAALLRGAHVFAQLPLSVVASLSPRLLAMHAMQEAL